MMHTPKPWIVFDYIKTPGVFGAGIASINENKPSKIAFLDEKNETANGRLIAVAPDLLDELRQCCDLLESMGYDCAQARKIIDKATKP